MSTATVQQDITPRDDKFNPDLILYSTGDSAGLSKAIRSISLHHYINGITSDIYITIDGKEKGKAQAALKAAGIDAENHSQYNASDHIVKIKNVDPDTAMIHTVTALAVGNDSMNGPLGKSAANQIIEHELARTGKSPVDLQLMTSDVIAWDNNEPNAKNLQPSKLYVTSDITHPLSAITYIDETGNADSPSTRIGTRQGHGKAIVAALHSAGIKAIDEVDTKRDDYYVSAVAPADKTAEALQNAGFMPSSMAKIIIAQAAEARSPQRRMEAAMRKAGNPAIATAMITAQPATAEPAITEDTSATRRLETSRTTPPETRTR